MPRWRAPVFARLLVTRKQALVWINQALNDSSNLWAYIKNTYHVTPQQFKTWAIRDQVRRIFYYVDSIIHYAYDIDNNHVFDYVSTPKEVLAARKDDCQGISCVLVSLLVYLGYDAYV